ncbi:hypothetical protein EKO04_004170 [Ascochyta lentis]|uniref:Uncharacterized protein n=1 Tax=Ascochyta lentis TaxID=205686 RepID=A0A8H7J4C4_9PLEO|nr:hypothetical protein EKO04_004170 [Ascochyta lentis]
MVLLLSVAILTSVSTTAAGFLSSKLLDNSPSEVLINGRSCGALPFGVPPSVAGPVMSYNARKSSEDLLYATQCYRHNKTEDCAKFVHQVLPYSSDINASCPFAPEMCKMAYGNLHLDTGTLDSVYHLGLNRGPRFTLQYRTHCAPLVTKGYTTVDTIENSTRKLILYNYGRSSDGHSNTSVHVAEQDKERHNYKVPVGTYKVTHVDRYDTGFIPQLTQPDAMVSLVFLDASEILYMNKTYDPWFSATTPLSEVVIDGLKDFYITDEPVSVLGCSSQRFLCNPAMPKINCVNSLYPNEEIAAIQTAWPQPEDQHQIYPILAAQYQYGVGKGTSESLYAISGAPTLLARKTMVNNRQHAELPLNHWQSEQWQAGSTLQLQRIAHENLGLGIWKRTDEAVPVTRADDLLGVFDTKNLRHARLVQPSEEANPVSNGGSVLGAKLRARN